MTIHRYTLFRPYSVNPIGDAMRHGDHADVARERAKTYTEIDPGGGDKWREMLLRMSGGNE
jgi:hypothetical protein